MSQKIAGTFVTASVAAPGQISNVLMVPSTPPQAKLNTIGLDVNNTIKTQKSTSPGGPWVDQTTYNADQTNTLISVAHGEQWRLVVVTVQAMKTIQYSLGVES